MQVTPQVFGGNRELREITLIKSISGIWMNRKMRNKMRREG